VHLVCVHDVLAKHDNKFAINVNGRHRVAGLVEVLYFNCMVHHKQSVF